MKSDSGGLSGGFPLGDRRVRFSLYRAKPNPSENTQARQDDQCEAYELEVVNATRSWGGVYYVSKQQIDQFIVEESERLALQLELGLPVLNEIARKEAPTDAAPPPLVQTKVSRGRKQVVACVARDSVVYPVRKSNIMLLALARRLTIVKSVGRGELSLRCYSDPMDTSLGRVRCWNCNILL